MSREIRFRAWDPKTETRIDDKYLAMRLATGALVYASDPAEFGWYDDTDYVLEQFTGLHDKNGVEIYEGDIDVHGRVMVYEDGCFWWKRSKGWRTQLYERPERSEVIGNVHQAPDLLA